MSRTNILVVDDEESMLKLLHANLSLDGYNVVTASNGLAALPLLEKYQPQLVILDIMMPGLNGLQVLHLIRQHSNVPIIMITSEYEETTLYNALELGADDCVNKPFSFIVLAARIKAKLRRWKQFAGNSSGNINSLSYRISKPEVFLRGPNRTFTATDSCSRGNRWWLDNHYRNR